MARKRRRTRHNTGGGRQPRRRLLDQSRTRQFQYHARQILMGENADPDVHIDAVIQMTFSKGARQGVDEARAYVREKAAEEVIDDSAIPRLDRLIDHFTVMA